MKKMNSMRKLFVYVMIVVLLTNSEVFYAKSNMVPNYEVKLLLDSDKVLNSSEELKKDYRSILNTGKNYKMISVLYIDTEDKAFNSEGWINRIRVKEDSSKFELSYKKRYAVSDGNITAALDKANTEGFDSSDTNYEAQIDWGYNNMTLSITRNKEVSNKGYGELELPKKSEAISILKEEMPGKEVNWKGDNWGTKLIENGKKYGEVYYKKYEGEYEGISFAVEVWEIVNQTTGGTEYITELSFKEDTYEAANVRRAQMMKVLADYGILVHGDSLKTQKVLNSR